MIYDVESATSLEELFLSELRELYSAEKQIVVALPKMAKAASSRQLRNAFKGHLKETEGHIDRLEAICEDMSLSPSGNDSEAVAGLIRQGEELIEEGAEPEVLDASLIAAAQKIEHYEIAGYGTVRTYAELLGKGEIAKTLQLTLKGGEGRGSQVECNRRCHQHKSTAAQNFPAR